MQRTLPYRASILSGCVRGLQTRHGGDQAASEAALTVGERLELLEKANELAIELYATAHDLLRDGTLRDQALESRMDGPRFPLLHKLTRILEREKIEYADRRL